jgi:hypothetical protein
VAAASFGVAGTALPAVWFLPSIVNRRDSVALLLFVGLPGAAAALAGALAGGPLCDPERVGSRGRAMLRGAAVATLSLVIFAPTFAVLFAWTAPGRTSIVGTTVLVLTFSAVGIWWLVAAVGGALGWLLHHLGACGSAALTAGSGT